MIQRVELQLPGKNITNKYGLYLAKNGLFEQIKTELYTATINRDDLETNKLSELKENIELHLPQKIPYVLVKQIEYFCRGRFEINNCESLLFLEYNPELKEFRTFVPFQRATAVSVISSEPIIAKDGFKFAGTCHSHPSAPFFSSIDRDNEQYGSGLHLCVGNLEKPQPDWAAVLCVHGHRKELDPNEVLELEIPKPSEWFRKLSMQKSIEGALGL